jgi:hypothetical protein
MDPDQVQICRGFTVAQWRSLRSRLDSDDVEAWRVAVDVFARRMRERYFSAIDALLRADSGPRADVDSATLVDAPADGSTLPVDSGEVTPGFAIVALTCLLIEALQSFRAGASRSTKDQFQAFLERSGFAGGAFCGDIAARFTAGVRNGLLHEAETRGWLLWRDEPTDAVVGPLGDGRFALNRTALYRAVRAEFDAYCAALAAGDAQLRRSFCAQVDGLIRRC